MVEETIEVEAEEGTPADLADGPIAIAIAGGRWAASDGDKVVAGDASDLRRARRAARADPIVGHDVKALGGGGRTGLLAAAAPGSLDLEHDTMVAAYLIDPARRTYDLARARRRRGARRGARRPGRGRPSSSTRARGGRGGRRPGRRCPPRGRARRAPARARSTEFGLERLLNEVEMPLIEVLAEMERSG